MSKTNKYIQQLEIFEPLVKPVVDSAIKSLELPAGSVGLDAGCGIGLKTLKLAEVIGPTGHVIGLDIIPEFIAYSNKSAHDAGLPSNVSFKTGNVDKPPFEDNTFDWVWSSDCVGYDISIEPIAALKELARVVKPGGSINLFAWSSEKLLPGYPLLEAKLAATSAGIAPFTPGMNPGRHFLRAINWFEKLGFENINARTFAGFASAPLAENIREALTLLFDMRWHGAETELPEQERLEYQRLCIPESPSFILNTPDYYGFFTYTMFSGRKPL